MPVLDHYEKTKDFFQRSAVDNQGYYDGALGQLTHNPWQKMIRRIIVRQIKQLLADDQTHSLVDIGCGNGDFCLEFKKRFPRLIEICGCDYSDEMLAILRRNVRPNDNIFTQQADLRQLPFANDRFDFVLCINTLHHVVDDDLAKAIAELARVSRQYVIIEIKNKRNLYKRIFHRVRAGDISVYPVDPAQIKLLFYQNGYRLIEQKNIFKWQFISPLIVQVYRKIERH